MSKGYCALESSVKSQPQDQTRRSNNQEVPTVDVSGLAANSSDDVIIQEPTPIVINDPSPQQDSEPHDNALTGNATQVQDVTWKGVNEEPVIKHRLKH